MILWIKTVSNYCNQNSFCVRLDFLPIAIANCPCVTLVKKSLMYDEAFDGTVVVTNVK